MLRDSTTNDLEGSGTVRDYSSFQGNEDEQ